MEDFSDQTRKRAAILVCGLLQPLSKIGLKPHCDLLQLFGHAVISLDLAKYRRGPRVHQRTAGTLNFGVRISRSLPIQGALSRGPTVPDPRCLILINNRYKTDR